MPSNIVRAKAVFEEARRALQKTVEYCEKNEWAGYDPYDALNSRVLERIPLLQSRIPRIAVTQLLKRSPVNLRPVLGISKTQNPKALSLFLSAFTKLSAAGITDYAHHVSYLVERLEALRSPERAYWCWGYSFPWQTRTVIVPSGTPNLVCTAFVAGALLDAFEYSGDQKYLMMANSAAEYIIDKLYWYEGESAAGFGYPLPMVRNQVHNANLMAAALLCRVSSHTRQPKLLEPAIKAICFSVSHQNPDGSWRYGEGPSQAFIDNFHTGFNLCALHTIMRELRNDQFRDNLERGFHFYREHFYLQNGSVRYFHNRTYPIDIHAIAQSIITPVVLADSVSSSVELAVSVFRWAMKHMWDRRGYFHYRVLRSGTVRIPYMRWSEAWMTYAIVQLLCTLKQKSMEEWHEHSPVEVGN